MLGSERSSTRTLCWWVVTLAQLPPSTRSGVSPKKNSLVQSLLSVCPLASIRSRGNGHREDQARGTRIVLRRPGAERCGLPPPRRSALATGPARRGAWLPSPGRAATASLPRRGAAAAGPLRLVNSAHQRVSNLPSTKEMLRYKHMLQAYVSNILDVSEVCCKCFIRMLQK
jgi:hypothetical protein